MRRPSTRSGCGFPSLASSRQSRLPIILASGSPQRRAILTDLGVRFDVVVPDVKEVRDGSPEEVVVANALAKARRSAEQAAENQYVLGADTDVFAGDRLFGKPRDEAEARSFLEALSGRSHEVFTGLALVCGSSAETGVARTSVRFHRLDAARIERYLATGEWRGRAGAYAVQGHGSELVAAVDGDYWNVVGLPTSLLADMAPWLLPGSK
jgi:septum formation protein